MIIQETPTRIRLLNLPEAELRRQLTYIDKSIDFELTKVRNNRWLRQRDEQAWKERIDALKAQRQKCLLFEDNQGFWTYSGLGWWLAGKFQVPLENRVKYPEPQMVPWHRVPDKKLRPYQLQMKELLLDARHGGVEVGTGLGKSFVILHVAKELGLQTVVMTPSLSIAEQIYAEFIYYLGSRYVGRFFGGKKESKKLYTIAVDDSLTKVEEGSEHWERLSQAQVFIADESHLCPAKSLARVCTSLLANAPYRFFFSGTQLRNDGLDLLLDAIIGKIVFRMSVKDGVDQGWLAKPMFRMIPVISRVNYSSKDANEMTRAHLYYVPEICAKAAEVANLMVEEMGRQVVVLIKELEQFSWLLPHFRHPVVFAHGGVTPENAKYVPSGYHDSNPQKLVKEFNEGKHPILVGTSCITTGTDIQTAGAIIYLQGGKSEIQVRQSVGRGTRKVAGKVDCYFIDFDVRNVEVVHRHAEERAAIYRAIYPDFEEVVL